MSQPDLWRCSYSRSASIFYFKVLCVCLPAYITVTMAKKVLHFYLRKNKYLEASWGRSEGVSYTQKFHGCKVPADPPARQHVQFSSDKTQFTLCHMAKSTEYKKKKKNSFKQGIIDVPSQTLKQLRSMGSMGATLGRTVLASSLLHSRTDHSSPIRAQMKPAAGRGAGPEVRHVEEECEINLNLKKVGGEKSKSAIYKSDDTAAGRYRICAKPSRPELWRPPASSSRHSRTSHSDSPAQTEKDLQPYKRLKKKKKSGDFRTQRFIH